MATNKKPGKWRKRTLAVRGGTMRTPFQETSEALFLTSGYAYEEAEEAEARFKGEIGGYQYSRFGNPTVSMFEARMAALEGAAVARATATGMAAVSAVFLSALKTGDHVVAAKAMFGSCLHVVEEILPRFGITYTLVDGGDLGAVGRRRCTPKTRMLFLETPSNPTLSIVDLKAVAKIADQARRAAGGGQCLRQPGVAAADGVRRPYRGAFLDQIYRRPGPRPGRRDPVRARNSWNDHLQVFLRNTGPSISPFNAWLHLKSLETLDLRMKAHCENATQVADFLAGQRKVTRVLYPFRADHPQHNLARAQMEAAAAWWRSRSRAARRPRSGWPTRSS